jgi:nickel/cobalt transporter (NicO) family protein
MLIFIYGKMSMYRGAVTMPPALLLAAAGVGVGHAVLPDHWLPLAVLSRTRRYRTTRVVRLSLAAALTHVAVSVVLGGILVVIGLQFRTTVARHADLVVGGILLATGAVFGVLDLLGRGHRHDGHSHDEQGHHHHGHGGHHDHGGHDHDGHAHEHSRSATAVLERPEPAPASRTARGLA